MNKKADFQDRYFWYRGKGFTHGEAKKKAIKEMIGFGLIKSVDEIYQED